MAATRKLQGKQKDLEFEFFSNKLPNKYRGQAKLIDV